MRCDSFLFSEVCFSVFDCGVRICGEVMAQQSIIRQNYHSDSEAGVNKQINLELYASYVYLSMVCSRFVSFVRKV